MNRRSPALLVFARRPRPGFVKTRLVGLVTADEAARIYAAFLEDCAEGFADAGCDIRYYVADDLPSNDRSGSTRQADAPLVEGLAIPPGMVLPQLGEGLGERMLNALRDAAAAGYDGAVIAGTDHPTLPTGFIRRALDIVRSPGQIAIGPSEDGGYYLIGMNSVHPALFEGVTYSHASVFEQTLTLAKATGDDVTVLPPWYDVDTPASLIRLWHELRAGNSSAPATRAVLESLAAHYGWS